MCVFSYLSSEMYISIHFMQQAASFLFFTLQSENVKSYMWINYIP